MGVEDAEKYIQVDKRGCLNVLVCAVAVIGRDRDIIVVRYLFYRRV